MRISLKNIKNRFIATTHCGEDDQKEHAESGVSGHLEKWSLRIFHNTVELGIGSQ